MLLLTTISRKFSNAAGDHFPLLLPPTCCRECENEKFLFDGVAKFNDLILVSLPPNSAKSTDCTN